ncbi:MAG: ornithine--oxo-acid transaminase [Proteobacteria bacterium]|nr:ornithine--oxo-acid transaminase [Pseudomonadota bacterium]
MSKTSQWIAKEAKVCAHNYFPLPVVLTRGKGEWVWDIQQKRYLDMMSAYSAVSLGHCHPRLLKALSEQAHQLAVVSRAFHTDKLYPLVEKLCRLTGMDMGLPMNSGAEAVETALKAVRRFGYEKKGIPDNQAQIIVSKNNFHGRTISVISFSSDKSYQQHFGPLTPGFIEIPFGDAQALKSAINPNTCAFLVEAIQGEAGIILPPKGWLKECEKICRENKVLLIVDEIQTGLARTGKMFAFEHENVKPDGVILGKALGGGILPISMFLARKEVMEVFNPGSHGSTFGGNPLACHIGLEVLSIIEEEKLVQKSAKLGDRLLEGLKSINHPIIKEVRGKGLFVGVEIDTNVVSARKVCEKLMELGVLSKETHETTIRFAPPLIIHEEALDFAITEFEVALNAF